jgi:ribose 1,5-bisphosphate isomerase
MAMRLEQEKLITANMKNEKMPRRVIEDIKSLRIQGSQTIAEAGIKAWAKAKDKKRASRLLRSARPTEPMLFNALSALEKGANPEKLIEELRAGRQCIAKNGAKLIHNNQIIYTHCHSSTVTAILKKAAEQGKKFSVHSTETRPLYQGRLTAAELAKAGIPVDFYIDSAMLVALKNADLCLIGADWVSPQGVANKIGTHAFVELALRHKIPVYCCTHSWKYSPRNIIIEERPAKEVWPKPPKGVKVHNPAFDIAEKKEITGIVSELGILKYAAFCKKAQRVMSNDRI